MNRVFLWRFFPFLCFVILAFLLWRGLALDPHTLPSTKIGQVLPSFTLPNLFDENKTITEKTIQDKMFLLNVWASWCDSCQDEQSFLMGLKKQGWRILGVNYKDDEAQAKKWLEEWGNPYHMVAADTTGTLAMDLGVYGTPETFLIDKNGIIRYRHVGILSEKVWQEQFLSHMSREPS